MKLKKVLISIYICILVLGFISLIVFSILGGKERIGYLNNLLLTNIINNSYEYTFTIRYYDKVFRNSDIYGVYIVEDSLPDYIKNINYKSKGSPFGTLVSAKKIKEEKIDNIKYRLKVKSNIFLLFILLIILFIIFVYILDDLCIVVANFFNKIDFFFILKKYIIPIVLFIFAFFILFNISVNNIFIVFILLALLLTVKKLKKLSNIKGHYIITVFLSFLVLPIIIYTIFGNYFDKNNYENRTKSEKPYIFSIKLENYPKSYENYFNDFLAFRNELIQLKNIIDVNLFKNIIHNVLLGKNDWLFYRYDNLIENYIGLDGFTDEQLEIAKNNLIHLRDELKKRNIDFVLMICPNKNLIYEENMPSYIKRKSKINSTDKFVEYMNNNTDIKIVYPKKELLSYKHKYQLYYKYDTHWNALGGYIGYFELMKKININAEPLDNLKISSSGKISGDLAGHINFIKFYSNDNNYIINSFSSNDYKMLNNVDKHYYSYESYSNNTNNILMIRDSFTIAMFDYIASSFYKSSFVGISDFKFNDVIDINPNIVVFQTVERFLKYRLLYVIPIYEIEEINNKNLETNSIATNN
ncbi:hypothetical protein GQX62_04150 [Brachyspira hyodysenteriae]|uniref:DHHW family protein n=1 Tax=Brachyspira hyodysenteriae TaxID=159 RepID=UPI00063DB866|nr:DHHW family protein [Brachyspira hyodysenteriae]KLI18548.1 hypothetical protein SU44_02245 [Brachyspira hyodysenteriae]MCZ9888712.1 DHHW family protein [Brachyspira hyodysenteriae]MDA0023099.1 DHHW family protein [Brachyspira hyodysenteriae]QTM02852.1 hypothetical protein GQX62_04150 [Brachyspira hyodysenteriae]QTM05420.1 hypothetical protein GQX61_04130 [Brachyspira hyodysenteriae]